MSKRFRIKHDELLSLIHACDWERSKSPGQGSHKKYCHINSQEVIILPDSKQGRDEVPTSLAFYILRQLGIRREEILNESVKKVIKAKRKANDTSNTSKVLNLNVQGCNFSRIARSLSDQANKETLLLSKRFRGR